MHQRTTERSKRVRSGLRNLGALFALATWLGVTACGSAGEPELPGGGTPQSSGESATVDLESLKLASVKFANGNEVGWYELAPGSVALRETFTYPVQPVLDEVAAREEPAELFQQLAPREAVPERLLAAIERSRTLEDAGDFSDFEAIDIAAEPATARVAGNANLSAIAEPSGISTKAAAVDAACPWSWFQSKCNVCATGPCGDWQISWPYAISNSSFSKKGYMTAIAICPYRGSVHQLIKLRGKTSRDALRLPGEATRWFLNNGAHKFTASSTVDDTAGDGYHHCGEGTW